MRFGGRKAAGAVQLFDGAADALIGGAGTAAVGAILTHGTVPPV